MRKIRVGNDFWQSFQIKEKGVIADLLQVKDTVQVFAKVGDKCFEVPKEMVQIKEDGIITMEAKTELFNVVGRYEIIVKYWHHDISMSDQDRKQAVNFSAFTIVSTSAMADDLEDVPIVGDIIIGLKGDSAFDIWNAKNGGNNTYDDWIAFLQAPATEIEGIVSANEAVRIENENTRISNEQTRVANESDRVDAETDRDANEATRVANEATRLTNEDDRIANENQRVIDEGKREQLYDNTVILKGEVETLKTETETAKDNAITATNQINTIVIPNAETATQNAQDASDDYNNVVKPNVIAKANYAEAQGDYAKAQGEAIQDDLALKADQADLVQLESDVEQLGYVKISNETVNGNFENGLIAPFSKGDGGGGETTLAINSSTPISGNYDIRLTIITPTTSSRPIFRGLHGAANIGDKIYLHFYAKILSGAPTISAFHTGRAGTPIYGGDVIDGRNTKIIDVAGAEVDTGIIYFTSSSVWDMQMDNFMRINLTETFGAGNEPTIEEMGLLLDMLPVDYFEGEITIPAQKIMQWQLKLIRKNKNAIIALGGTII